MNNSMAYEGKQEKVTFAKQEWHSEACYNRGIEVYLFLAKMVFE